MYTFIYMRMVKYYLTAVLSFLMLNDYAQQLSQVTFSQASDFAWFSILTNQNILIRISDDGKILEYGTEEASLYNRNYFAPKLLPYQGVVLYYQHDPDSILNGKIKNIGTCYFTYYGSHDYPERIGKLKSVGSLTFDYYRQYDDALIAGRIKNIGTNAITYYGSFDNEALKGKLKSVGNTSVQYYSSFDNISLKGKLKSIGAYHYDWNTTSDGREFVSYLKTGNQRQLINGITYIPQ
ncbi:MAG TPA: hypothetical protein VHB70_00380 [Parafilimonas sp.]|nr:hypothetical protein [Parafilimonas sp.]